MAKIEGESFGHRELSEEEKRVLVEIDASRVRAFMDLLGLVLSPKTFTEEGQDIPTSISGIEIGGDISKYDQYEERFKDFFSEERAKKRELLWGGFTLEGLGVAFVGLGELGCNDITRVRPELGVIADPTRDKALILRADLWHGNAEDSWDSGWDQHSYSARDSSQKIALLKPIDEWGVSVHRGHYDVSLREDPHFLYNGDLYQADVLLQRRSLYTPLTATLGKTLVRVDRSEDSRGYPAYSFDYQIEPHHNVYAMHYFVLDSYSSV